MALRTNLNGTGNILDDIFSDNILEESPDTSARIRKNLYYALRTVLDFSYDKANAVFLYVQIDPSSDSAGFSVIFRMGEKTYLLDDLDTAPEMRGLDLGPERQVQLAQMMADNITGGIIPIFTSENKALPNEIWTSYDLDLEKETGESTHRTTLGYNMPGYRMPDIMSRTNQWRDLIEELGYTQNFKGSSFLTSLPTLTIPS